MKGKILLGKNFIDGFIVIDKDLIQEVIYNTDNVNKEEVDYYDYDGSFIIPGFIDTHIHGGWDYDFLDGTATGINKVSKSLLKYGVTGFLPTFSCCPLKKLIESIKITSDFAGREEGAHILGIHLEGPFINKQFGGGLNKDYILSPDKCVLEKILEAGKGLVKKMTIAPEIEGSSEIMERLVKENIVISAGHSSATYEEMERSLGKGLSSVTHIFNAMPPLYHRAPGIVGASLLHSDINAELIADGIHVRPEIMKIVFFMKGSGGISLISDSIKAAGMDDGIYETGGLKVIVTNGTPRLRNGKLAGSTLSLGSAVKNIVEFDIANLEDSVAMASENP